MKTEINYIRIEIEKYNIHNHDHYIIKKNHYIN